MRAAMGRHERFFSKLAAGFKAEKNKTNLDWRRALECCGGEGTAFARTPVSAAPETYLLWDPGDEDETNGS